MALKDALAKKSAEISAKRDISTDIVGVNIPVDNQDDCEIILDENDHTIRVVISRTPQRKVFDYLMSFAHTCNDITQQTTFYLPDTNVIRHWLNESFSGVDLETIIAPELVQLPPDTISQDMPTDVWDKYIMQCNVLMKTLHLTLADLAIEAIDTLYRKTMT